MKITLKKKKKLRHSTGNPSSPGTLPDCYFDITLSFKSPSTCIHQLPNTLIFASLTSATFSTCSNYCPSPPNLNTITPYLPTQILYNLISCLLSFPHSHYLFPKHFLLPSKSFPRRSPHRQSATLFATFTARFRTTLCARYLS